MFDVVCCFFVIVLNKIQIMLIHQTQSLDNIQEFNLFNREFKTMGKSKNSKKKTNPTITKSPRHKPVLAILPKRAKISRKR